MQKCMNSNWDPLEGVKHHLLTTGIVSSYINWVYSREPVNLHSGMPRFDEGTSSNPLSQENEMLGMLHDLHANIGDVEGMEEGLDNEISFNNRVDL